MKRTQLRSSGTVVPPLVTTTSGRARTQGAAGVPPLAAAPEALVQCRSTKAATFAVMSSAVAGHAAKNCSGVQSLFPATAILKGAADRPHRCRKTLKTRVQ